MYILVFFILGICMGSFSNVVIHRLPIMMARDGRDGDGEKLNLFYPRSHCPNCHQILGVFQLFPVISWLFLLGKCSKCNRRISSCYPLVELLMGILYSVIAWQISTPLSAIPLCFFVDALVVLAVIDHRHFILPDVITMPLIWAGMLWNSSGNGIITLSQSLYGAVSGYLSLWLTYWLYLIARKREGLGYGDFKLCAAMGAWLGLGSINFIMLTGSVLGIVVWKFRRSNGTNDIIPFGPSLCCAALIYLGYQLNLFYGITMSPGLSAIFGFASRYDVFRLI